MPLFDRMRDADDSEELVWAVAIVLHHVADYVAANRLDGESTRNAHIEECDRIRSEHQNLVLLGKVADSFKHSNKTEKVSGRWKHVASSSSFNNFWEISDFWGIEEFWGPTHKVDGKDVEVKLLIYDVYAFWRRTLSV